MSEGPLQKKLDRATVHGGLWATAAALMIGYLTLNRTLPSAIFIPFGLIIAWALLAIIARAIFARQIDDVPLDSRMIVRWIGARLALYFAATILLICWLVSLPVGSPWSNIAGRALILTLLASFLTSAIGQGAINSAILMARIRRAG